jgi:hypothetical protein
VHEAEVVSLYFDMQTSGVELWLMGAEAWMRCSVVRRGITTTWTFSSRWER